MGETVDALGYKADVPARARDSVSGKVDSLKSKITGVGSTVAGATPEARDVKEGAEQAVGIVQENPLGLAIGAAALGFLAGMLVPSTKIEDERIGPIADQVKETGQDALEHGKQVARETAETAATKAQETVAEVKDEAQANIRDHAHELSDNARESANQFGSPA
jgi:ElaB/YqjD/DUF883 family membrane-anchored ribosome-binding protein